jgi:hypothetical protein
VPYVRFTSVLALAALGVCCHSGPPPAIDPTAAASVPPGAVIVAGINLGRLRSSPLHQQLPPAALALLEPLRTADSLLFASSGSDYIAISRGSFRQAPAGATLLEPGLAAAGSPGWLRAATARQRSAATGPNALLERAEPLAKASAIWMVVAGSATLPVSGNAQNLNSLLHTTQYATLSVQLANSVTLAATGECGTPGAARHLEETLRAFVSLGSAGSAHQPAVASLLRRIQVSREDSVVRLNLQAQPADLDLLFKLF